MKILFISRRFPPEIIGGGQISALYIAQALQEKGCEVVVLTFHDSDKIISERYKGIQVIRHPIKKLNRFRRLSNLDYMYWQMAKAGAKTIKEEQPDIIHLLNFESIPLSSIYFKKKFNIPIVATVNGPLFGCFTQEAIDYKGKTCTNCRVFKRFRCSSNKWGIGKGMLYYAYSIWFMRLLRSSYSSVDKFLPISTGMIPLLANMGVKQGKISVVHNPIGPAFPIDQQKVEELKKNFQGKKVIMFAGRFSKTKGIQTVISTLQYLPQEYIVVLVGWSVHGEKLKQFAQEKDVEERTFFIGKVQPHDIGSYFYFADLFCHFPTIYEAFGRTLIESMSVGTPVLAYPIGGIPDIVENGVNGFLVNSYDPKMIAHKIQSVMSDKELYQQLSKNAKKTVNEKFSNKIVASNYIKNYEGILNNDY